MVGNLDIALYMVLTGSQQNIPRQRIVSPVLKLQKSRYLLNEQFDSALQVSEQDGLPDQVCVSCAYHVDKYLEFKEQCQASDWKLRQRLTSVDQEQEIIVIKEEADLKDAHDLASYRRPTRPMLSRTSDYNVPTLQDVPSVRSVGHNESKLDVVTRYRDFLTCVNVGVCPDDQAYKLNSWQELGQKFELLVVRKCQLMCGQHCQHCQQCQHWTVYSRSLRQDWRIAGHGTDPGGSLREGVGWHNNCWVISFLPVELT
uniref:ZAD domain-containing protein n=1 Tax=Timema shepardi TaxID=629360 RepID=A0A7R9G843_TIMSH|nr:unnamed protein product [Timema shepardi]